MNIFQATTKPHNKGFVFFKNKYLGSRGFTLVELLIVIAVIGVLAAVVLTVINPLEQLSKTRDAGRLSTIGQLSKAVSASYISNGSYPAASTSWLTNLVTAQELKSAPKQITGGTACAAANTNQNGFCYSTFTTGTNPDAAVWTPVESTTERRRAGNGTLCAGYAVAVWIASQDKVGVACLANSGDTPSGSTTLY